MNYQDAQNCDICMIDVVLLCYLFFYLVVFCINPFVCSLFCNFCFVYIFLKSDFSFIYFSLLLATCFFFGRSSLIGTHTPHGLRCLNFCTALCLHNEDDIYSVNECGCFVCWFVYLFWLLLLLLLLLCICM